MPPTKLASLLDIVDIIVICEFGACREFSTLWIQPLLYYVYEYYVEIFASYTHIVWSKTTLQMKWKNEITESK